MILKRREKPYLLETLPRLLQRIPERHASWKKVEQELYRVKMGYEGEVSIDQRLRKMRGKTEAAIICDFQFQTEVRGCQIDTLVLTPHYALVLEVKNFNGTLKFNEETFHLEQTFGDGQPNGYHSPISQVLGACEELEVLFQRLHIALPVFPVIVLPNAATLVVQAPVNVPIVYGQSLNRFISNIPRNSEPINAASAGRRLLEHHVPFPKIDYAQKFQFNKDDLKTGVLCGICGAQAKKVSERVYGCAVCQVKFKDGRERALQDWFEFISPEISNEQCRAFLRLKDKHAARYLLKKMKLTRRGCSRGTVYEYV
ncbi:nuclease-related domain-containing protein [Planococcus sp. YIM B11945]|uniref:nuclease-related domain-containing protein n=1 Tax=Planococcus sp. YIM B11945 TaxID=3435410 RepID=UPI003D7E5D2C